MNLELTVVVDENGNYLLKIDGDEVCGEVDTDCATATYTVRLLLPDTRSRMVLVDIPEGCDKPATVSFK